MEKVNAKKIVFWTTFTILSMMITVEMIGGSKICGIGNLICREKLENTFLLLYSFPFLFLLSLITYRMHDDVFHAWWNFARWFVPIIIAATLFFETKGGGGGGWGISSGMDEFIVLFLLYGILIIVSIVQIVREYWRTKK